MGYAKLSVTIPGEVYEEIKAVSSTTNVELSHLAAEALSDPESYH